MESPVGMPFWGWLRVGAFRWSRPMYASSNGGTSVVTARSRESAGRSRACMRELHRRDVDGLCGIRRRSSRPASAGDGRFRITSRGRKSNYRMETSLVERETVAQLVYRAVSAAIGMANACSTMSRPV